MTKPYIRTIIVAVLVLASTPAHLLAMVTNYSKAAVSSRFFRSRLLHGVLVGVVHEGTKNPECVPGTVTYSQVQDIAVRAL
jgi:hypothetical protein